MLEQINDKLEKAPKPFDEELNKNVSILKFKLIMNMAEIYNEMVNDLLSNPRQKRKVRQSPKGIYIENVTEETFINQKEFTTIMLRGFDNRHTGATKANSRSSRSHTVIQVSMQCTDTKTQNVTHSMMNLIDLAGAEKQKHTGATGDRLLEAQNINKSLSTLGTVMEKIVES